MTTEWRKVSDPPGDIGCSAPDGGDAGEMYRLVQVNRATDPPTETVTNATCSFEDAPASDAGPPPAPSTKEVRDVAVEHIEPPKVHTNPAPKHGGITGLENWFWYEGPKKVTAESAVRGYTVTATMRPARFVWKPCATFQATRDNETGQAIGCPTRLESRQPGREPHGKDDASAAAARWTYETEGRYTIRHHVIWHGEWTYRGHGQTDSGRLSRVRTTGETTYQVNEVRSQLTHDAPSQ